MAGEAGSSELVQVVALLGAGVVAVPIFKRLGLGSILGYLAAGLAIGPFGLGLFDDPEAILHVAELGVVMFLFIIGLEMRPSRLWGLRTEIFGLGLLQVAACRRWWPSWPARASCSPRRRSSCSCWRNAARSPRRAASAWSRSCSSRT
jgi:hypothetical protein